jgi:hypothetical protein
MARRHRAQASRGYRHGRAGRRAAAEKDTPESQSAQQAEKAPLKLGCSPESVYQKAHLEDISLRPTNQSPYNRRKK